MAAIYLKHPVHGSKVASTEVEAKHDRENGWEDFDPMPPSVPSFLQSSSDIPETLPGRQFLIEGGLTTWASIAGLTYDDLIKIDGIGAATAKRILEVLNS